LNQIENQKSLWAARQPIDLNAPCGRRLDAIGKLEMDMNIAFLRNSILAVSLICVAGNCQGQQVAAKPVLVPTTSAAEPAPAPQPPPVPAPLTVNPNYVIGAGDSLNIEAHEIPEQTETVPVRPDGKISLPMIHDIPAAGYTPEQLGADITARLTKYYRDPVITVSVVAVNSKHIYLAGEVSRTGPMDITPGMTILQAIASAGLTPYANRKHIRILRGDPMHLQTVKFDYNRALKKGDMQGVSLMPGDTIVVP
jgi:polysaccharide export outer membrane protein